MSLKDKETVKVVFRKFKDSGDIIALFPESDWNGRGEIASYQHIGQHSGADYNYCVSISAPATPKEYNALKRELESIGYDLIIRKRYVRVYL